MPALAFRFAVDGLLRVDVFLTPMSAAVLAGGPGGLAALPRVRCGGVLDTGATLTCISSSLVGQLGLPPGQEVETQGISGTHVTPVYTVTLGITDRSRVGSPLFSVPLLTVGCHPLADEDVIIGMDVIGQAGLSIDGPAATFTLHF